MEAVRGEGEGEGEEEEEEGAQGVMSLVSHLSVLLEDGRSRMDCSHGTHHESGQVCCINSQEDDRKSGPHIALRETRDCI